LRLRAAAIRAQVGGKTVALLRIVAPQSFVTVNDAAPVAAAFIHDLGLHNSHLRPQQYPYGCTASPSPPKPCTTNTLFAPIVTMLTPADALLVEGPTTEIAAFERTPFFRGLPSVRAGHIATATSYEELGPLGLGFLYSALERAFGLVELHRPGTGVTTFSP